MAKKEIAAKAQWKENNISMRLRMEASLLRIKKFVDGIVDLYSHSTKIEPHEVSDVIFKKAASLMEKGLYGRAIDEYNRLVEMGKEEASIYYNLGVCCEYEELYEEAEKAYKKTVEIDKNFVDAFFRLGMLAIKDDNPKLAVKYLNLLTSKKEVSEVPFDVLYQLGVAYDKMKDYENAIENFKRAISIDSRYSKAYKRLGYT